MSYIDSDIIKSFVQKNSWLSGDVEDTGVGEIIEQIDSIVFNKTGIAIPEDPEEVPGIIRNAACALFIWFTTGKQAEIDTDERIRRRNLYEDAMQFLNDVESGKTEVLDDEGNVISHSKKSKAFIVSEKRITGML